MKLALMSALIIGALIAAASAQIWIMSPSGGGTALRSHGPPPVNPCSGAIDLSSGCGTPMIGIR